MFSNISQLETGSGVFIRYIKIGFEALHMLYNFLPLNPKPYQLFSLLELNMFVGPGIYYIRNNASSTLFDMDNSRLHLIHGWQKVDNQWNQKWRVVADPNFPDMWSLRNMEAGQYLNLWQNGSETRLVGSNIQTFWWLTQHSDETTSICFPERQDTRVADLHNGSKDNDTPIKLLTWNAERSQKWTFDRISD
ncbi:unnamed protein product [Rhizoctonia solani]|uniref:Ricin B lectin domain-containing protein n=1 Tax=Rhizoctonia solani TaxID=456999 RepID=A0A8H3ABD5_9AGAM|nr:unnamed protein product [Rhizoctonia solani]CAE6432926.1 unnamed protein product [Rhizoctonia solani]